VRIVEQWESSNQWEGGMVLRIFFVVCLSLCLAACGGQTNDKTAGAGGGSSKKTSNDKKSTGTGGGKTSSGNTGGGKTNGGTKGGDKNGGKTTDPHANPPDGPRLTDGSPLAGLGIPELVARLADSASRREASNALVAKGPAAVDELTKALDSPDWQLRYGAVGTLGQLGSDAEPALDALRKLAAEDDRPDVREAAQFAVDAIEGD
jgi:hypothetical protein